MDSESLKVKNSEEKQSATNKKVDNLDKKILSKDEEIKELKLKLSEAQQINKMKKGDIRAETNREGDPKLICIGLDNFGRRLFKKATELTDSDIARRDEYINSIKQLNARKY